MKSASLGQVARAAGIDFPPFVRQLQDAGMAHVETEELPADDPNTPVQPVPDWAQTGRVRFELDADQSVAAEEHLLGKVRAYLEKLGAVEILRLTSSFYPAPLI